MTAIPYAKVAAVIRFASIVTANKLTDLGQKNETQFMSSLKEFLAFFCSIACNEICIRRDSPGENSVKDRYDSLREAFFAEQPNSDLEPLRVPQEMKLLVAAMVNAPESNFHSYFRSYWNGDLNSLRVSPSDIEEAAKRGVEKPSHGETGAAAYALLMRACRYENPDNALPPTIVFLAYDKIIREEVENFLGVLRAVLQQGNARSHPEHKDVAAHEPAKEEYFAVGTQKTAIRKFGPSDGGGYFFTKEVKRVLDFDGRRLFIDRRLFRTKPTTSFESFECAVRNSMSFRLRPDQGARSSYSGGSALVKPDDQFTFPDESWVIIGQSTMDILWNNTLEWSAARSDLKDIHEDYQMFENSQNWKQCVLAAQKAIDLHAHDSWGWIHRSCALHRLSMTRDAFEALKETVELFPKNTTVRYNMACYCSLLGDSSEAREWLSSVFKLAKNGGDFERYRKLAENDPDLARIRGAISRIAFFSKMSRLF